MLEECRFTAAFFADGLGLPDIYRNSYADYVGRGGQMSLIDPMIVLPKWTLGELSTSELNSILIHELAHIERRDDWTNLAQRILRALFFFHPAVWWVERQLSLEREMACDDVVLARTANQWPLPAGPSGGIEFFMERMLARPAPALMVVK